MTRTPGHWFDRTTDWQQRLASVLEMARSISAQTDPQKMVQDYGRRVREMYQTDGWVSLSRRNLTRPEVRITRASIWGYDVNPWTETREPIIHRDGLFSKLAWIDEPTVIDDLEAEVPKDDPAWPFLVGMKSASAIPLFDQGAALNMVVGLSKDVAGFPRDELPERVWMSNLFGRATHNLVLSHQVKEAYEQLDREMKIVGDIQRSLLPSELPDIPGVELAVHYQTSTRAGGDYYDFFALPNGMWGILLADVSGHGTPAAVLMAVTHSIAHTHSGPPAPPSRLMDFVNRHLAARYTNGNGTFVTAFYGIYDPATRRMTYASAGHCPPRVKQGTTGTIVSAFDEASLPLGIDPEETWCDGMVQFEHGDTLVLYTDGITEARTPTALTGDDLYGIERLDQALASCPPQVSAAEAMGCILQALGDFTGLRPPADDQTLLVAVMR